MIGRSLLPGPGKIYEMRFIKQKGRGLQNRDDEKDRLHRGDGECG